MAEYISGRKFSLSSPFIRCTASSVHDLTLGTPAVRGRLGHPATSVIGAIFAKASSVYLCLATTYSGWYPSLFVERFIGDSARFLGT